MLHRYMHATSMQWAYIRKHGIVTQWPGDVHARVMHLGLDLAIKINK